MWALPEGSRVEALSTAWSEDGGHSARSWGRRHGYQVRAPRAILSIVTLGALPWGPACPRRGPRDRIPSLLPHLPLPVLSSGGAFWWVPSRASPQLDLGVSSPPVLFPALPSLGPVSHSELCAHDPVGPRTPTPAPPPPPRAAAQ